MLTTLFAYLITGAWRPVQPPSMPELVGNVITPPKPQRSTRSQAALTYSFVWSEGFIGSGSDVMPPEQLPLQDAIAKCDAEARCRAITYEGSKAPNASETLNIYFKSVDGVQSSQGWSTWVKTGEVQPPAATIDVGGSSRLQLLLRQDFYSVQNLSRAGEKVGAGGWAG